jgi:hypothetical protein
MLCNTGVPKVPPFLEGASSRSVMEYWKIKGLQINLYLEQPMEIQLFATFFQRRKGHKKRLAF